ncbi:hypothetical protein PUN28_015808 [Cardiocondyla obscurior]|uniref:Uncharacterized protein n=1 Tax=Cardiocondyla obscurior TaxID=286306 RepID=A0AAW2EPD1_9HYME
MISLGLALHLQRHSQASVGIRRSTRCGRADSRQTLQTRPAPQCLSIHASWTKRCCFDPASFLPFSRVTSASSAVAASSAISSASSIRSCSFADIAISTTNRRNECAPCLCLKLLRLTRENLNYFRLPCPR